MKKVYPIITGRSNPMIVRTASLHDKKGRTATGEFLIEGEKLLREAVRAGLPIVRVLLAEERAAELAPLVEGLLDAPRYAETEVQTVSGPCFEKISTEKAPQGVIAVLKHLDFFKRTTIIYDEDILALRGKRVVLLYAMQDPGNLGAVIRSAVAFGADALVMSRECADLYNPKTVRAAMGNLFGIRALVVEDFAAAVSALRREGRRVLAAELRDGAVPLGELGLLHDDCILIGNEGHGIPAEISALCDRSVYLPISERAESLNAAVAAAIFMWEMQKSN